MFGFSFNRTQKENVDFIVYVSEVSANTIAPYTSKSPRHQREH